MKFFLLSSSVSESSNETYLYIHVLLKVLAVFTQLHFIYQ